MPGFTTHYLFGQQAYQKLYSSELRQTIQKYHTVFALGLQGPDIFFYYLPFYTRSEDKPGSLAHTANTQAFLRELLKSSDIFLTKSEKKIAQSYVLGFIGHYLLDCTCHPYVYGRTGYDPTDTTYLTHHLGLETDIDTTLLWHFHHRHPSEFHAAQCITLNKAQLEIVSTALYFAFSRAYPFYHITKLQIRAAICAMQKSVHMLYDPTGYKKVFIRRMEQIFTGQAIISTLVPSDSIKYHKDPLNLKHRRWRNPWDKTQISAQSFLDLFECAEKEYISILEDIERFFQKERSVTEKNAALKILLNRLGNRDYHSGLSSTSK